jgi:hypothetical protein
MSKGKRTNKFGGLSYNDPINKIRRLKAQNDKAQQGNKPDWEDKYEYGLSDW